MFFLLTRQNMKVVCTCYTSFLQHETPKLIRFLVLFIKKNTAITVCAAFFFFFIKWLLFHANVTREKDCSRRIGNNWFHMFMWYMILSASRSMRVKSLWTWAWFLDHVAIFSVDSWSAIYSMNPLLNAPLPWSVSQDLAVESNWREKL